MRLSRRARSTWRATVLTGGAGLLLATVAVPPGAAGALPAAAEQTIGCPSVGDQLPEVPEQARAEVDRNLAQLDAQIREANARLASSAGEGGPDFVQNAVLGPLRDKRVAAINRIATAIGRVAERPELPVDQLATCTVNGTPEPGAGDGGRQTQPPAQPTEQPGQDEPAQTLGPVADDFVDIRRVAPNVRRPKLRRAGSRGTFTSRCGRNENGHFNSDNVIVAPGVVNGAHHTHDYVGNLSTDGFSTNESLDAAGTTCTNGDKSTYYWPVLRLRGPDDTEGENPQATQDLNIGRILRPATVSIQFRGNPVSKVTAMPRFLRIITGDAKSFTNGIANANAKWSCTGFGDRVTTDKYPICPRGSRVMRIAEFQSCWDGRNIDSANHRTHVAFADRRTGACPSGFKAIPALRITLTYNVKLSRAQIRQGTVYALDGFPEQLHKPITDHNDFVNVMSERLMRRAVKCINSGRRC